MLVSEILDSDVQPLLMMEDNQGAISYATNAIISERIKHVDDRMTTEEAVLVSPERRRAEEAAEQHRHWTTF
eukprot:jgi/Tetstr1/436482/TSEL_025310.t1